MKSILAVAVLALVTLVFEEKARQVAGEAQHAYGEVVDQARASSENLSRKVEQQPIVALVVAAAVGYVLSGFIPRR
jgi:ElaB/YqjD/DUF883 family membrane-anchored ribosome-binding protein